MFKAKSKLEPTGQWVEPLFDSVIKTYNKLKELGFVLKEGK
jgi:hypothetical protein